ncbi:uncharacterized protein CANTADRAFT_48366 [Suhomyces tanzawaensis NRRL Y-17324]|uniref:NADPH--cytochrome P450 reductase n=1 Tax=Suhomyces tanzawaensis NRRL Y-17324 TaxID=984487 RepID=A0A1E4SMC1_9ASCO|nr:uncharacterized protein CANTADRAFT_48366 [Suhomyces tanzawaensis NRRL Y-17324]ODV80635.1 hypothetical protein CANTADRAFT_48366 [Suhomyces tanzawaensis NRRL Y-17324]
MALNTLDYSVLLALAIAVVAYYAKSHFFANDVGSTGFLPTDAGSSRNIVSTVKDNNKNAIVFYGSQTGTAEDYASKLLKELSSKFGLKTMTVDFADYDFDNFDELDPDVLCFFLMATYGEGEPTDNANDFIAWLDDEADTLSNLKYTVFGLGNSTYEFYNAIGKKIDQKLEEKGGERFAEYGEGDDGVGTMDEDYFTWKDKLIDSLKNNLNFEEHEMKYEPSLELSESYLTVDDPSVSLGEPNTKYVLGTSDLTKGPFDNAHPYLAQVKHTQELFNSKSRSCVHAEFDISPSNLRYSTGDHLAVWPSNSNENVETFAKAFGLADKLDDVFELKSLDSTVSLPFHTPITYGAVLRHHLEISGPVSRQLFLAIAGFAPNDATKKSILELGNDKVAFADKIHHHKYNIADALLAVSKGEAWSDVPFEFIIEFVSHLQPRYYSISSSSLSEKTTIHVTAVVEAEEVEDRTISGVVTNLLKNIEIVQNKSSDKPAVTYDLDGPRGKYANFKVPVHIRRSTFKLPTSSSVPVIMIGPGTGVAPFRGFVRERVAQKKNDLKIGPTVLFYGCRNETEDFLYKNEWPEYSKELGSALEIHTAFSRQDPSKKVYVQHKLLEQASKINQLIADGAFIYVCGDASRMARDVQNTLVKILAAERNIDEERAAELVRAFKVQNRYQEDVW